MAGDGRPAQELLRQIAYFGSGPGRISPSLDSGYEIMSLALNIGSWPRQGVGPGLPF